jgi:hypothetical protein
MSFKLSTWHGFRAVLGVVEALDWLFKNIRASVLDGGHHISTAAYRLERYTTAEDDAQSASGASASGLYALRLLIQSSVEPLPNMDNACWLPLFDSCVVIDSPPTTFNSSSAAHRIFGKGLELSFELMIALTAADFHLVIDGGLVFVGYQTVLYPVETEGECAQFHLIVCKDGQINPYLLEFGVRYLTDDPRSFRDMRCFVGWCEAAHINLGTRNLPTTIRYSGGQDQSTSLELDGYSMISQLGASAPLSAILGLQTNFRFQRHRVRFTPSNNYLKLLHDASQQLAVVYDAAQDRCWLIPKLSLLLHMSHVYAVRHVGASENRIPFVEPHADACEILRSLELSGEIGVFGASSTQYLFRELLLALSINLLKTAEAVRESSSRRLYGFEFMDVVDVPGKGTCMRRLSISTGGRAWVDVANAVGTVIVCSDLGEAITAVEGATRMSPTCNHLPRSRNYLATTLPCLARLTEQRGRDLYAGSGHIAIADRVSWNVRGDPFSPCEHHPTSGTTCWDRPDLVQRVIREQRFDTSRLRRTTELPLTRSIPNTGAVVFGEMR